MRRYFILDHNVAVEYLLLVNRVFTLCLLCTTSSTVYHVRVGKAGSRHGKEGREARGDLNHDGSVVAS